VHGDVFRPPRKGMLLSVLLGSGVQVYFMTLVTLGKLYAYEIILDLLILDLYKINYINLELIDSVFLITLTLLNSFYFK